MFFDLRTKNRHQKEVGAAAAAGAAAVRVTHSHSYAAHFPAHCRRSGHNVNGAYEINETLSWIGEDISFMVSGYKQ